MYLCYKHKIYTYEPSYELPHEKINDLHSIYAKTKTQISFAVAPQIAQYLYFLNLKFPAFGHLQCLYSSVCVGHVRKPHCWFSHEVSYICISWLLTLPFPQVKIKTESHYEKQDVRKTRVHCIYHFVRTPTITTSTL